MRRREKQVYRFIEQALDKSFRFQGATNAQYSGDSVHDVILFAAMTRRTPESAVLILRDRGKRVPSADVVLNRLRKMDGRDMVALFKPCLERAFRAAKKRRLFVGRKRVAVDIHEKPFYGEKDTDGVVGGMARAGTTRFYAYITLEILHEGCRYTLAAIPVTDKKQIPGLVDALIEYARMWVKISIVLLDRGFLNAGVIKVLEQRGLEWLMAAKTSKKLRRHALQTRRGGRRSFTYIMNEGKPNEVAFTVFMVAKKAGKRRESVANEAGGYHYFATNREVKYFEYWADVYRKRWGIDTGYRVKKQFLFRTAVKTHCVRVFAFLLSVLLQNVWELLGRGEDGVTADLFRDRLVRICLERLQPESSKGPPRPARLKTPPGRGEEERMRESWLGAGSPGRGFRRVEWDGSPYKPEGVN